MDKWDNEHLTLDERTFLLLREQTRNLKVINTTLFIMLMLQVLGAAFVAWEIVTS